MNDEPATEHERWAEVEATFCDRMVDDFKRMATEWTARSHHPDSIFGAMKCAIFAEAWAQMGQNMRRPRRCRIENEARQQEKQP